MNLSQLRNEMENYKSNMTSSERIEAYLSGARVDHLPYDIFSIDWIIASEMGYTLRDMDDIDKFCDVIEQRISQYNIVGISEAMVLRNVAESLGSRLVYPENEVEHIAEFIMDSKLNMDLIKVKDPMETSVGMSKLKRARILKDRFPDQAISTNLSGPITVAAGIRPINKLLRDFRKQPEEVHKLLEFCVDYNLKWVKAFINEFGVSRVMIADPIGCDDILSPAQIKEFAYPYLKRLIKEIYEMTGIKPGLHVCGHTKKQWESYKNLDISLFSLDNCEDLEAAKVVLGDSMIIAGNVPPVEVMRYGDIDDVIDSVKKCIIKASDSPKGFICATGCDIPIETPKENVDAFIYAVQKYGKEAKIGEIPESVYR